VERGGCCVRYGILRVGAVRWGVLLVGCIFDGLSLGCFMDVVGVYVGGGVCGVRV